MFVCLSFFGLLDWPVGLGDACYGHLIIAIGWSVNVLFSIT